MLKAPCVSVIIPVHTARGQLKVCLDALTASSFKAYEIIVVDDASSDDSAEMARRKGAFAFSLPHQSGPAAAGVILVHSRPQGRFFFFLIRTWLSNQTP